MVLKEIVASNDFFFFKAVISLQCSYTKLHFLRRIFMFTPNTQETCTKSQMGIPGIGSLVQ